MSAKIIRLNPKETNSDRCLSEFIKRINGNEKINGIIAVAELKDGSFIVANSNVGYAMVGLFERLKMDILDDIYSEI